MVPRILADWNLARLTDMLDRGIFEAESFDYKEFRIGRKSEQEKQDIRKDCCAFANSQGGFLVFGVTDSKTAPTKDRLVGIDKTFDFPREFGSFPQECKPSVRWDVLNPPIDLGNGKVIHVIHIPQSWRGPHCISADKPQEGFVYPKRTNRGNEFMNYEEVRMSFLGYYEKRLKLQLLQAELQNIISDAASMMIPDDQVDSSVTTVTFSLNVIETVLIETYAITAHLPELAQALLRLRNAARSINNAIQMFNGVVHLPFGNKGQMVREHNLGLRPRCVAVTNDAQTALAILQAILAS
jgi:hypothetical protein